MPDHLHPIKRAMNLLHFPKRLPCAICGDAIDLITDQILYGTVMLVASESEPETPTACICGVCRTMSA